MITVTHTELKRLTTGVGVIRLDWKLFGIPIFQRICLTP